MYKNYFCLIISIFLISLQTVAQVSDKNYKVYSVNAQKEITLNEIINDMENYQVLIFGEEHNDSVAHYLENKLLELMFEKYKNEVTLSLEMFDRDVQLVMNEYLDGFIREKNFTKDARSWSNYRDYKPMIEFAKKNLLHVICANAPTRYTNLAGRKGQTALEELNDDAKKYFAPLPYDTASGKYYEKLKALFSHNMPSASDTAKKVSMQPTMPSFNMILSQSLWDATMAYSITEYWKKNKQHKILQINGRFHSDERMAIVTQLENYAPKINSLVISTGSDETFPNIDWNQFKHLGDYIIITDPMVPKTFKD